MSGLTFSKSIALPLLVVGLLPLFAGCSGSTQAYKEALQYAFFPAPDVQLTPEQLAQRPYDSLYAKVGNLPQAVLVLAAVENGLHKWRSADQAMLVLQKGRLVRSSGFLQNIHFSKVQGLDPISKALPHIAVGDSFERVVDGSAAEHSGELQMLTITAIRSDSLPLLGHTFSVSVVEERVQIANRSFTNEFWFDNASGLLLKSVQQAASSFPPVELTHINVAYRLLPTGANDAAPK